MPPATVSARLAPAVGVWDPPLGFGRYHVGERENMDRQVLERAEEHFARLLQEQLERIERMKKDEGWVDYEKVEPIVIGVCW